MARRSSRFMASAAAGRGTATAETLGDRLGGARLSDSATALRRIEDLRLLRGRGQYVDDIDLPGTAHMAVLRSPYAHARVRRIEAGAARALPGVVGVFTAADLPEATRPFPIRIPHPALRVARNFAALALDRVRYAGEPVAVVVAADRYLAEDALERIEVDYEPLPAVADLERALSPDAPLVHEDAGTNLAGEWETSFGDAAAAFAAADVVVRATLRIDRGCAQPMETRAVLARHEPASRQLTVWATTQAPHRLRAGISALTGLLEDQVRVIAPDIGGAFGQKGPFYPEDLLAPLLALRLGRPVKFVEDRREHFLAATHERLQVHEAELAVARDGRILGLRDRFLHDLGAYAPYGFLLAEHALTHMIGCYRIPAARIGFRGVYTNKTPTAAYRGAGRPQGTFVIERMVDLAAAELGLDAVEMRRRNLIDAGDFPYDTGLRPAVGGPVIYDSGDYRACLEAALARFDYAGARRLQAGARARGRYLGIAVVNYVEVCGGPPYENASVRIDGGGRVIVHAGTAPQGQGHETTFAQLVAERLGVDPAAVTVRTGDTGAIAQGIGTFGSRSTMLGGSAVAVAAERVRDKLLQIAARLLEAAPADLELRAGMVRVRGVPGRETTFAEVAAASQRLIPPGDSPGLEATYAQTTERPAWANGAHAALVEVDPHTGGVRFLRYVVAHDCGRVINPLLVEGQVHGGIVQGLGGALYERLAYDEQAQLQTASFLDYLLPTAAEMPRVEVEHLETPCPLNPLGAKGAGEGGTMPAYALVAQAVEDALAPFGARVTDVPLTPAAIRALAGRPPAR